MLATDLLQDFVSSDPVRRLQPGYDVNRHQQRGQDNIDDGAASPEEEHVQNNVIWIYIAGMVVILFVVFGSFRLVQNYIISTGSDEFAIDHTVPQKPRKSTLDERKQAILELFETSQVTMEVTDDDIYGEEEGCIEDMESGCNAGGILKLSRPVAATSNSTLEDPSSSPLPPPEWCQVQNMCAICLDSYEPGQGVAWSSGCRHAFHQDCISHYLAKKMIGGETPCPSCRQKFCELPEEPRITSNNIVTSPESTDAGGQAPSV